MTETTNGFLSEGSFRKKKVPRVQTPPPAL